MIMNAIYSEQDRPRKKVASLKSNISILDTKVGSPVATKRIRGREHGRIRLRIMVRDGAVCAKCGCGVNLEVHHKRPLHLGGSESDENRVTLCGACHRALTEQDEKERQ